PAEFWEAADIYERSNGRTCSSMVVALPKELSQAQRIELAEQFISEFADSYRYPFTCAIHNHAGSLGGKEQPHLHFMYSERHVDGIERTAEQFFKRYNPKDPHKGGAQKLTADVLGMGKAQLQLYRQKTEELINESLRYYAPTKMVEIRGIQVEVPSLVSCLSNQEYNKKHGTQLKDVPVMNKAVRFAREKEPALVAERERMTAEINRLRAENNYELYRPFYEAELENRKTIEEQQKQVETPRTRQRWYAQEKLLFLQQKMLQTLLQDRQTTQPLRLIQHDLQTYIDLLNTESFDRVERFEYLRDLGQQLEGSVIQIASIDEELAFIQRQVIERVPLQMREKAIAPEKTRNQDKDNGFSPRF
ncbi:MobA/MobL family protein, partial [Acinetobacter sp. YH12251]